MSEKLNQSNNEEEKDFSPESQESEPTIVIKKSVDAPPDVKKNPFFDPEFWGQASSITGIYLPDSDEALSFTVAMHEIGHLVERGKRKDAGFDNFEATRAEEQRAWDEGWKYLQKYLSEYYRDKPENIIQIQQSSERIRDFMMEAVDLSKDIYLHKGALDGLNRNEQGTILKARREKLFDEKGEELKQLFKNVKQEKNGVKPDWNRFVAVVKKAVRDIIKDNKEVKLEIEN